MSTKTKTLAIMMIMSVVGLLTVPSSRADVENMNQPNSPRHMRISVDGFSSYAVLRDAGTDTNGFINVSRDQIANTTFVDFSYATPSTEDPEIVYFIQGMGDIANNAFSINLADAHLAVTTPFASNSCVVNVVTSDFDCDPGPPVTFDLSWVKDGLGSIHEKLTRRETNGPVTIKFKGEYDSVTTTVNGTRTGHGMSDSFGNLFDNKNNTTTREITLAANP